MKSYSRGTYPYVEHYWQYKVEELPVPAALFYEVYTGRENLVLAQLVGSVMLADTEEDGKPLFHAVIGNGELVEYIGGLGGVMWTTDFEVLNSMLE